jgi:hypothetical protein
VYTEKWKMPLQMFEKARAPLQAYNDRPSGRTKKVEEDVTTLEAGTGLPNP